MATFDPKTLDFVNPVAPNLPLATALYERQYQDQFSNVLRLYFNQLDNAFASLLGPTGGKYLRFPYGAVQRTTDKTFTADTATLVTFDQTDYLNGMTNDTADGIHVQQAGIYNYQFSVQLKNTDTQIHSAWVWLRKNGVDIAGTGSKFDVTSSHGGTPGFVIAAANFYIDLNANDYVEMWGAVNNVAITFDATAAQTSPFAMPSIPSVVATLSFVSRLPT
jgi:hypothetical protein